MDQKYVGAGAPPAANLRPAIEAYPLEFTGTGGEYFRVWIVNVLLTIVTIALFTPVARWRTAKYFYSHTLVAESPLEFVGRLARMVVAFFMLIGLYLAFKVASETGQETATVLFLVGVIGLAPFLWGSAMRFRLSATRWRGLRPRLAAKWTEIYLAAWPMYAFGLIWAAFGIGVALLPEAPLPNGKMAPDFASVWPLAAVLFIGAFTGSALAIVRLEYNFKRLLVTRARIGGHTGVWRIKFVSFLKIWLQTFGFVLAGFLGAAAVIGAIAFVLAATGAFKSGARGMSPLIVLFPLLALVLMFIVSSPARAYREAKVFQLMWNNIGLGGVARFKCNLSVGSFVWLRIRNVLLTLVTLGFWRPFAKVSEVRMKTASVTLHVRGGLDNWVGQLVREEEQGFGDAIADAVGIDLIG